MKKLVGFAFLPLLLPGPAWAQGGDAVPEALLLQSIAAVEKATQEITSLEADYVRTYNLFGQTKQMQEEGKLSWKRTADGKGLARWDGRDEKGPVVTLARDRELTVWRGKKRERAVSLEDSTLHHASRFNFPFLPPAWKARYAVTPAFLSPDYDDRWPRKITSGIPLGLAFVPSVPNERYTFKRVTYLFDEKKGLAYKYRCETFGWQSELCEIDGWKLNGEMPDAVFEPPDKGEIKPEKNGAGGGEGAKKESGAK